MAAVISAPTPVEARLNAWDQLGEPVAPGRSITEALEDAHMANWNVRKTPLFAQAEGRIIEVPNKHVVLRDNPETGGVESFGVVGNWWKPFQNEASAQLLADIVDQSGADLSRLGTLNGGRKTFVSMKLPGHMEFTSPVDGSKDVTDLYLAIFNSHDGTGALSALVTPIRLFCANQQRMAESTAKSRFAIRHTGNADVKLSEVRDLLGLTFSYRDTFVEQCEKLIAREMDNTEVFAAMRTVSQVDSSKTERIKSNRTKFAEDMFDVYRTSETVTPFRGTAFGAYNAVTEFSDHYMSFKKEETVEARATRTLTSEWIDTMKERAFAELLPV
jgi:phage/plasmid-like protein (TIGR03299 family)